MAMWQDGPEADAYKARMQAEIAAYNQQYGIAPPAPSPFDFSQPVYNDYQWAGYGTPPPPAPAPNMAPEVTKPMQVSGGLSFGGGTMYAGGSNNGVESGGQAWTQSGGPGGLGGTGGQVGFNPSLSAYQDDMARRQQKFLGDALQGVRGSFVGSGGLGGGRQAIVETDTIANAADNLQGQYANMNLQDWTGQQNRNLTSQGMRDSFYTSQRGQDLQAAGIGAGLLQQGLNSEWTPYNQANQTYGTYGGNGTTTQNQSSGGGWLGGLGGALGVANLANQMGWWK